jgi:hypothetical protein
LPKRPKWIDKFVDDLFIAGNGEQAERLMLWRDSDRRDLGGWCRDAIADRLYDAIVAEARRMSKTVNACSFREDHP